MLGNSVQLIHRVLDGEDEAFTELVQKYQKKIHALAWRKIKDYHIAEEITQDIFLQVYEKLPTLKNPQLFEGWLYIITNRLCLNWIKKNQVDKGHLNIESLEDTSAKEKVDSFYSQHQIEQREKEKIDNYQKIVNSLLELLPESERTVIILYYLGEMTTREIGKFLGISVNTIKSHLRRARNRLKEEEELLINENLGSLQLSTDLTESITRQIADIKPTPPVVKPVLPWVASAAAAVTVVLVLLLIGTMPRYFAHFQKPFDFETLSEPTIEIVESPINSDLISIQSVRAQDPSNWHLPEGTIARLGKGTINEIQYSPDGKILAAATVIGIWLYDTDTYKETALLASHTESITGLDFNADGSILAAGADHKIVLWDMSNHTQKSVIEGNHKGRDVQCVAFSPDGKTIAGGTSDGTTYLYDVDTGIKQATYSIRGHNITSVEFSPDGQFLLIEDTDSLRSKSISLRNVLTGKEIHSLNVSDDDVNGVAFSPDGKLIASTGEKKDQLLLWNTEHASDDEQKRIVYCYVSYSMTFSSDSKMLAIGQLGEVSLIDPNTGERIGYHTPNTDQVISVAFSPDMKTLASATDHEIYLWDIFSAQPITTFNSASEKNVKNDKNVKSIAISPDGSIIASGGFDDSLTLWDAVTGVKTNKFEFETGAVNNIAFSPDGNTVAVGTKGVVHLLDRPIGQINPLRLPHLGRIFSLMYSPDGKTLACSGHNGLVILIDVATGKQRVTLRGHDDNVNRVVFNPKGTLLVSGGDDEKVILWDAITGEKLHVHTAYDSEVWSLTFSPDGKTLAIGGRNSKIGLLDVKTKEYSTISAGIYSTTDMSYSSDGKSLVTSSMYGLCLWDMEKGKTKAAFIGHEGIVTCASFNPIDGSIVSGGVDGTVRIWNSTGGGFRDIATGFIEAVSDVEYSPDGNTFATTGGSYAVRLWDATTNKLKTAFGGARAPQAIAYSPDGNQIATGGLSDDVKLWDANTGEQLAVFKEHADAIESLDFSPDGKTLVSGARDGLVVLWDLTKNEQKYIFKGHQIADRFKFYGYVDGVAFNPDGQTLVTASPEVILLWNTTDKEYIEIKPEKPLNQCIDIHPYGSLLAAGHYDGVFLWHATTGKKIAKLEGHTGAVISVAFSPDARILASGGGGSDNKIILWDITTTQEIATLSGHTGGVRCVAFSPDGNTLVSGSWDGTALIWDIAKFR